MGKVSMMRIGLTRKFNRLNTTATIKAVRKLSTETPGRMLASKTTASALSNNFSIKFIGK